MKRTGFDQKTGDPIVALEVTPEQVDVGAHVVYLVDQKPGVVEKVTAQTATVKFEDGTEKDVHFGRLIPGPGAVGPSE